MTQLIGTGKDPRYPVGQPFDVPDAQSAFAEDLVTGGLAVEPVPTDDPVRIEQVAHGLVRGDSLTAPEDAAVAAAVTERDATPHDIVQAGATAQPGASDITAEEAAERAHQVEGLATTAPDEHISEVPAADAADEQSSSRRRGGKSAKAEESETKADAEPAAAE